MRLLCSLQGFQSGIHTQAASTVLRDVQQAAHHGEVLHEVDHLVLIGEVGMKDQRGRNHEDKQEPCPEPRTVPQKERERPRDLNSNRPDLQ